MWRPCDWVVSIAAALLSELTSQNADYNSTVVYFFVPTDSILSRVERDCELGAPGDGDVRFDASLHGDVSGVRVVLRVPENATGGSADLRLLRSGWGTALHLRKTLQVGWISDHHFQNYRHLSGFNGILNCVSILFLLGVFFLFFSLWW